MIDTIGFLELNSIAKGLEAADAMLKKAEVDLIFSKPGCPGKYYICVAGETAEVRSAVAEGTDIGGRWVIQSLVLPRVHEQVLKAINLCVPPQPKNAVGMMEFFAVTEALICADAAVKAARNMSDVNTKIISWGHKLSFAYAELDAGDEQLENLAQSICDTNQLLCSSCQGIFVNTTSKAEQTEFAERFFEILKRVNGKSNPVDYGIKAKTAINLYNEKLEDSSVKSKIYYDNGVSVISREDKELELSYLYRNVWIKRLPVNELYTLKKHKNHLQTACVLTADSGKRKEISAILARIGIVRITSAGNMSRIICGEAHDGTYALREYSRIVETEM